MITVHHLEDSRSQRVLWLLEELAVEYDVVRYERDDETRLAPNSLRAVHPLGKSPVIEDKGVTVAETGAIFEYLLDTYDTNHVLSRPRGTQGQRDITYWLHYAEGSAMTPLLLKLVFSALPQRSPALVKPLMRRVSSTVQDNFVDPRLVEHIEYWESALATTGWFAGEELTAADIMMSFPLEGARASADLAGFSKILSFIETCAARPAYQRALDRGGPYSYA